MPVKICKGSAWQVMFPVVQCSAVPGPRSYLTIRHQTRAGNDGEICHRYRPGPGIDTLMTPDYLDRRKEPSSSGLSSAITPSQEARKETQPCPDENRMTLIRSDFCDHWTVTGSLLTLLSAIKSVHRDHYHIP